MPNNTSRTPKVSVLIRSMNRDCLWDALASVEAQTCKAIHAIIVNATGREHDAIPDLSTSYILLQDSTPLSRPEAANKALEAINTPFALFLDDDDLLDDNHIERLVTALDNNPNSPAAYTGVRLKKSDGSYSYMDSSRSQETLLLRNTLPIHAVLFRRSAVSNLRFDINFNVLEDWDFWLQLSKKGDFAYIPGDSATYHLSLGSSGLSAARDLELFRNARRRIWDKWLPKTTHTDLYLGLENIIDHADQAEWDAEQLRKAVKTQQEQIQEPVLTIQQQISQYEITLEKNMQALKQDIRQIREVQQEQINAIHHQYQGRSPFNQDKKNAPNGPVDVIVPVYKGLEETKACIESILASNPQHRFRLLIINDASPLEELTCWLRKMASAHPIILIENDENLGFVRSVNRGMKYSATSDVVLLNSDTEVANDWLDRLIAAAYKNGPQPTATVTPFSNNATICSYPKFCEDNELPQGHDVSSIDKLCARVLSGQSVEIPTAVGFCMYIRRDSLIDVGLFDEKNFGKGYGEENDFCLRASKKGWRHLLTTDTYVWHKGNVSFGDSQPERVKKALAKLDSLHPDYQRTVHHFIQNDPIAEFRTALEIEQLHSSHLPCALMINHQRGGGTEQHCRELAQTYSDINWLILRPDTGGYVTLKRDIQGGQLHLRYHLEKDWDNLVAILRYLNIQRIHYHHWLGFDECILDLAKALDIKHDVTLHDFYSVCTQITLTDNNNQYAIGKDGECQHCLKEYENDLSALQARRNKTYHFLRQSERVITPSADTAQRIRHFFPDLKIIAAYHPDSANISNQVVMPEIVRGEPLRVAVIGALSATKGADTLEAVAKIAQQQNISIAFKLFGYAYRSLGPLPNLHETGHYSPNDLRSMLLEWKPHIAWFPAKWPETYSYTLSSCLKMQLPVVASNLGAFNERLAGREKSWILPWDTDAQTWLHFFYSLYINDVDFLAARSTSNLQLTEQARRDYYCTDYISVFAHKKPQVVAPTLPDWRPYITSNSGANSSRHKILKSLYWLRSRPLLRSVARVIPLETQRRIKSLIIGERLF